MTLSPLQCEVTTCPHWVSNNTTAPESGHCDNPNTISCYRRSKAMYKGVPFHLDKEENNEESTN